MEKKTIGRLIQALRRSQGMTQRELAERLYVSDKTVSRWECDECTPELSLIPALAEIFDITTDELLRGERRSTSETTAEDADSAKRLRAKSEKQFRTMLRGRMTRYKNLSMLSVGLLAAGVIASFICNFAFYRGSLAFFLGLAFMVAGAITEVCFAASARMVLDEEDEVYRKDVDQHNREVVSRKWSVLRLSLFATSAILPFVFVGSYVGLEFGSWIGFALVCLAIAFLVTFVIRTTVGNTYLDRYEGIAKSDSGEMLQRANRKSAKKTLAVFMPIAVVLIVFMVVWENLHLSSLVRGEVLEDVESFQTFMAEEGKRWWEERWGGSILETLPVYDSDIVYEPNNDNEGFYDVDTLYDGYGQPVCTYIRYFDFVWQMEFSGNDLFPITVYTSEHYMKAASLNENLLWVSGILLGADIIAGCLYYTLQVKKNEKKAIV